MLADLRPHEDIIAQARQHWSWPASHAIIPFFLLVSAIAVALLLQSLHLIWSPPWPLISTALLSAAGAVSLLWLCWVYLDWADDVLIITTHRLIWLEKTALISEHRREIPLHRIQNVSVNANSLLANWLHYGALIVEASGSPPLIVPGLSAANAIRQQIFGALTAQRAQEIEMHESSAETAVRGALGWSGAPAAPPPADHQIGGLVIWHRHWWFLIKATLRPAILILLVVASLTLIIQLSTIQTAWRLGAAALVLLLGLIGVGAFIWHALAWREDRYILDGDRLLDIAQAPFRTRRLVKETKLERIQDVSYSIPHPLAHLLNYGDVLIQTAGETQQFTFDGVADPRAVHAEISRRLITSREANQAAHDDQQRTEVLDILRAYHDLTQQAPTSPPTDHPTGEIRLREPRC